MSEQEAELLKVRTKWNGKANVCIHCGSVPERFYIVTGHDHTDDSIDWCPCRDTSPTVEALQRQLAQANAVINEQKETIEKQQGMFDEWQLHCQNLVCKCAEQSALIEKLAGALDGLYEPGELNRVKEALTAYNQWKEKK